MDLADADIKIDRFIGDHAGVALGDATQAQTRWRLRYFEGHRGLRAFDGISLANGVSSVPMPGRVGARRCKVAKATRSD